ncbi:SKI family transcriptional corepressor 2 [Alligator mississippiensis]|uniref:SKI family transcriptional corepressor 2 n=1 Tax=Alligator mississippiensis TaxID=8496 RepID=A0A151MWK0_ALLMI|nr:SKI family transcriptional corepressor 2 [Alligator mississippiensis]
MASSPLPGPPDLLLPSPSSTYPAEPRAGPAAAMKPNQNQKSKDGSNQAILPTKEDNGFSGNLLNTSEHTQETNSPHSLKKDVENMGKEELQKVLFEQIDLRRRLEQEFQVLKGNASFPVFNNFQDQMKRELAYREEMVQQLQIIPYAASLIRKEKLGTHLSKS